MNKSNCFLTFLVFLKWKVARKPRHFGGVESYLDFACLDTGTPASLLEASIL